VALNTTTQILTAQQRRILSLFHFIFAINWKMINVAHVKRGLQWISFSSLAELVFADDIYLTFHCHLHMHGKTYYEQHKAEKLGLKITQKRIVDCILFPRATSTHYFWRIASRSGEIILISLRQGVLGYHLFIINLLYSWYRFTHVHSNYISINELHLWP
jgi:hypothetical protein